RSVAPSKTASERISILRIVSIDNMQTDLPRRTQRTPRKAWKPGLRASPCPPWLMPFPLSEDGCAHTHAGRTFFNCNFKIVRHAHRQNVHANRGQAPCSHMVTQSAQLAKIGPRFLCVVGKRRNGHQPAKFEVLEPWSSHEEIFQIA